MSMSIIIGLDIGISPAPCGLAAYDTSAQFVLTTREIRPEAFDAYREWCDRPVQ